jgi:alkanesulfonate monooxygenase SsuD/methylene tetrahydromethanopterin reductase-like flavin-dependent oxidoreductase (luciferase family)
MRIALGLPSRIAGASGELMLEWATRAEQGPFSSLVVTDRVVSQALEPLSVLAMAAGATRRIGLMTSVVIGPTRETTLLARQAATIDALSGGRLTLGLGVGVRENDYWATGLDFHRRGRRNCRRCAACGPAKLYRKRSAPSVRARPARAGRSS